MLSTKIDLQRLVEPNIFFSKLIMVVFVNFLFVKILNIRI